MLASPNLLNRMDLANLPRDHPCYIAKWKKTSTLFFNKTDGHTMYEFVTLRTKSYAYDIEGVEKITVKVIRGNMVKNHMTLEYHKRCKFVSDDNDDDDGEYGYPKYTVNVFLISYEHKLMTTKIKKLTYNKYVDKPYVHYGHYTIE